jgi:LCP family protein required for cell wall assembly
MPPTVARHGRLRAFNPFATLLKVLAAVVAVGLVSAGSVSAIAVFNVASEIKPGVSLVGESAGPPPQLGAYDGGINLLLVGSDSGEGDSRYGKRGENLNDVTILLHVSKDHTNATVISFPRDMFVRIPACPRLDGKGNYSAMSSQKINTTLSYGGLACTVLTVSQLTGLDIPFAAKIEFNGVIQMADAIGGVPVCVATAIHDKYTGLNLEAGEHTLQGSEALQFLRTRHGVGDGSDLGRISNQQVFMSSLVRTMRSADTLANPVKVFALAKAAAGNMQLSNSLGNINTVASIAFALKDVDPANVVFLQYPSALGMSGTQSGVLPLTSVANTLFTAIKADQPVELTGTTGIGSKLNPDATPTPSASPDPSGSPQPSASVDPSGAQSASPEDPDKADPDKVALPDSVKGQTGAQETCSKGQRG